MFRAYNYSDKLKVCILQESERILQPNLLSSHWCSIYCANHPSFSFATELNMNRYFVQFLTQPSYQD